MHFLEIRCYFFARFQDKVRLQDQVFVITPIGLTKVGRDLAWNYIKENREEIVERYEVSFAVAARSDGVPLIGVNRYCCFAACRLHAILNKGFTGKVYDPGSCGRRGEFLQETPVTRVGACHRTDR